MQESLARIVQEQDQERHRAAALVAELQADMVALRQAQAQSLAQLESAQAQAVAEVQAAQAAQVAALQMEHAAALEAPRREHAAVVNELKQEHAAALAEVLSEADELREEAAALQLALQGAKDQVQAEVRGHKDRVCYAPANTRMPFLQSVSATRWCPDHSAVMVFTSAQVEEQMADASIRHVEELAALREAHEQQLTSMQVGRHACCDATCHRCS
jgi:hypothetical protein